ncbi:hypothetical protein ALC53_07395 [Atta colombica]|uniref:Uncharacterized protein n=1 Tax=Atta colombica TaxID=520822 RepID=A0A195BD60_9HYME|nr:hypothetical protein ALC53_07395 [Atta colombica]
MVSVAVQCTSGHEVVQQVRPTGEPDETTSGPGRSPCPRFSSLFHSTLIEKRPYTLDLTKTRTSSLFMFTRAPFVVVAGGSCGEGMTMVLEKRFLKKDVVVREIRTEYTKMIKLLLTISTISCIALNNTAVLHIHSDIVQNLNLEAIMDEFVSRNKIHSSTFACST